MFIYFLNGLENSQKMKLSNSNIDISLHLGVPDNQILLHLDVPDNKILLHISVPNNCLLKHTAPVVGDTKMEWNLFAGDTKI